MRIRECKNNRIFRYRLFDYTTTFKKFIHYHLLLGMNKTPLIPTTYLLLIYLKHLNSKAKRVKERFRSKPRCGANELHFWKLPVSLEFGFCTILRNSTITTSPLPSWHTSRTRARNTCYDVFSFCDSLPRWRLLSSSLCPLKLRALSCLLHENNSRFRNFQP